MENILFTPVKINSIILSNRLARSATQDYMANNDGSPNKRSFELYDSLKGIGLIISGYIYVSENGKCTSNQMGLYNDSLIPAFEKLVDTVHGNNGIIFAQIVHGGVQVREKYVKGDIWSPSGMSTLDNKVESKKMTEADIFQVIDYFVFASERCIKAGFDGIQFHGAHGYLLSQFLSPYINKRNDQWGGSIENRARIILEILKKVREIAGPDYPVTIKMNGNDGGLERGLSVEDAKETAKLLAQAGMDAIEVSQGIPGSPDSAIETGIDSEDKEAYILADAEIIKREVNVPVMSVGGFRSREVMEQALKDEKCDIISLCRPFIREPDLAVKMQQGREKSQCISCNKCFNLRGIKCVFNK